MASFYLMTKASQLASARLVVKICWRRIVYKLLKLLTWSCGDVCVWENLSHKKFLLRKIVWKDSRIFSCNNRQPIKCCVMYFGVVKGARFVSSSFVTMQRQCEH